MAEEMMLEDVPWESDEAVEDIEADEALAEAEDAIEDIGERVRSRARGRRRGHFRPTRGVRGIVVRGQDGRPRNMPFPAKLATAAETNRGLATQEVGRRALEERLAKLEAKFLLQQKKDSSISGVVSLAIGVPLTAWGALKAPAARGSRFGSWADEASTKTAAVVSATQLATTGAKLLINGKYHRSGIGLAADVFAGAQLVTFAFASMYRPEESETFPDIEVARKAASQLRSGQVILVKVGDQYKRYLIVRTSTGNEVVEP
jgi:hypothetical protein